MCFAAMSVISRQARRPSENPARILSEKSV
jgi:hypothetical protein